MRVAVEREREPYLHVQLKLWLVFALRFRSTARLLRLLFRILSQLNCNFTTLHVTCSIYADFHSLN